jgi:hypothetical protein
MNHINDFLNCQLDPLPLPMADYAADFPMEAVDSTTQAQIPPALPGPRKKTSAEGAERNGHSLPWRRPFPFHHFSVWLSPGVVAGVDWRPLAVPVVPEKK